MKVIVAGSRDFTDYPMLERELNHLFSRRKPDAIISGGARGADSLGEKYAHLNNLPVERFDAEWDKYGKGAGYRRNVEMAENATHLVAFWDGQSRGTNHMIATAIRLGLTYRVIRTDQVDDWQ